MLKTIVKYIIEYLIVLLGYNVDIDNPNEFFDKQLINGIRVENDLLLIELDDDVFFDWILFEQRSNKMDVILKEDYDDLAFLESQTYYHGTSDILNFNDVILPAKKTSVDREGKSSNKVWITTNLGSAERYSYKAADKFGGKPIIYEVKPDFDTLVHRMDYEYICDFAEILTKVSL